MPLEAPGGAPSSHGMGGGVQSELLWLGGNLLTQTLPTPASPVHPDRTSRACDERGVWAQGICPARSRGCRCLLSSN